MASQFNPVNGSDDNGRLQGATVAPISNVPPLRPGDPRWVENSFTKRDCVRYVASAKDVARCACGQNWAYHKSHGIDAVGESGEVWSPAHHTASSPTDAYGTIDFLGGPHPNKAQFIRLGFESRPDLILQLLTREWSLELPKLIISVHGGKANFELQPRLKRILRKGLLRAAKTTGAWILTGGTNTGVTKHVGDALISERSPRLRGGRVVSIGIAPWGVVENRATLVGRRKDVTYLSIDQPRSKFAVLNNRHAYFLLADNGTVGRYGAEIALRRKLEKYISSQRLAARTYCSIPVVCLIVEGGMHTIRTVLEYVTDSPPVPVVVVEGSGRAADLIAFAHKYASESDDSSGVLDGMHEQLAAAIQRTFSVDPVQAERLLSELLQCVRKKDLITIYRPSDSAASADITDDSQELDHAILSALFRSRHLSAAEQLSLALAWNRVDIARSEIFVYGQEWSDGALEEAMMEALVHNRVDFVKLLLENGVQMNKFLTIPRLEELYNSRQGPANTLRYIVRDVRPHMPRNYHYTLIDIGLVINKLMGGAYRSSYTRRKFRHIYTVLTKRPNVTSAFSQSALARVYSNHVLRNGVNGTNNQSMTDESGNQEVSASSIFSQPFNELLLWAVLTKRQVMAKLMWHHGEEALAKALVASSLYRAMASEAADDDLEVEVYDELRSYAGEFDREALELLDYCYRQDDDLAQQLLTCELPNWSRQTCLCLAFACHHRELLAHPCAQLILGDLWLGGLRTRRSTNLKVVAAILCPPLILRLEFKSKQELQLMPQTEEEHMIDLKDERDDYDRSSNSSSSSSSSSSSASSSPSHSPNLSMRRVSMAPDVTEFSVGGGAGVHHRPRLTSSSMAAQQGSDALILCSSIEKDVLDGEGEGNTSKDQIIHDAADAGYERKRMKQLRIKKKLYEFYAAPITKFWSWSMAYFFFLIVYTYTVLIRTPPVPEWNECYVIAYITTFGGEKIREILASEPVKLSHKFRVWSSGVWNCCDAFFVVEFLIAMGFRLREESRDVGHVLYCLNIVFWYIRILRILQVSKFLGPFVTMIGRMLEKMIYYITLMLVVLMSYGVFRQSVLFPHEEFSWFLVRDIFFKPYFMIYGELFASDIDPPCGNGTKPDGSFDPDMPPCETGRWLNPLLMTCYLLVANILLLNLLIAVFNSIFLRTNVYSHQIWKFNRFSVVMEYEQKPALPPPLIIFSHFFFIAKWCRRRAKGIKESYDYGLKLFLDKDDLERLYDFEEESMEGLVREREMKLHLSTDERVRVIGERIDAMGSKIEDGHQRASQQHESLQSLDYRLMRLEEVAEQTSASLAVIHRFMVFQGSGSQLDLAGKRPSDVAGMKRTGSSKSSPNVAAASLTAEDFKRHLIQETSDNQQGRRSSCAAYNPEEEEEDEGQQAPPLTSAVQLVDPQDLAKLKSLGQGARQRQRTASETSQEGAQILHAMQEANRELDHVAGVRKISLPGRDATGTRRSSLLQSTVPLVGERNSQEDDDLVTTRAMASRDPSEPGSPDCGITTTDADEDEEITEVFENANEADDVMPGAGPTASPMHRSCSVSGRPAGELRKRFRNWSGTHTGTDLEFSPRSSRRLPHQRHKSPDEERKQCPMCPECANRELGTTSSTAATEHRRARLQPMLSCPAPPQTKWNLTCNACQLLRSSHSCGSFTSQPALPAPTDSVPKINIIPPTSLPRSLSNNASNRPTGAGSQPAAAAAAKVEAEAEHLREIEGQDYQMMEGIIRRRLHRDSEDLDNSLEDLCNAPIPLDEAMDSFDEAHEIHQEAVNFMVGETLIDLESEKGHKQKSNVQPMPSVKASSEPPEHSKKAAPQRPTHPPLRRTSMQKPKGEEVSACGKLAAATVTLSTMLPAKPVPDDVKIDVEAEEQV